MVSLRRASLAMIASLSSLYYIAAGILRYLISFVYRPCYYRRVVAEATVGPVSLAHVNTLLALSPFLIGGRQTSRSLVLLPTA